jgi:hypothetical protein
MSRTHDHGEFRIDLTEFTKIPKQICKQYAGPETHRL